MPHSKKENRSFFSCSFCGQSKQHQLLLSRAKQEILFTEGRASAVKKKTKKNSMNDSFPFTPRSVGGIQSKVCPVTCSLRSQPPAESQKTKAIRGGRPVCGRHRDTFLKASIMDKLLVVAVESD